MRLEVIGSDDERRQARETNRMLEELMANMPRTETIDPAVTRAARAEGRGVLGAPVFLDEGDDRTVPGPALPIALRVFAPPAPKAVYLHIHGGGWVLGSARQQDVGLWDLAQRAEVAVVSVDYRLAPEDPWPAAPDDCEAAALWLLDHAVSEFGTSRLLIGGESAGAHLAVVTLLRLRDRHDVASRFEAANLVYGAYDLGLTPSVRRWGERVLVLSTPLIEWFVECFTPGLDAEARRQPEYSPLYADLHDLPPALFTVGTADPLLDDNVFLASRWQMAGNRAELAVYGDGCHAFNAFPMPLGRRANDTAIEFLAKAATG